MDFSTPEARVQFAAKHASKYGLDVAMVCAVCEQESDWNPWAVRYEPAFYERYIFAMSSLTATEMRSRAMSWGLMQIMGQTAREFGYEGTFLSELCDPDMGVDVACRKLQKCFEAHGADENGLLAYNGGGNPDYGKQVLARVAKYQVPT